MPRFYTSLVALFCACLAWSSAVFGQDLTGPGRQPIERGPVDVAQLTRSADLIIRATVTGKQARWVGRVIYTHYEVSVQEAVKGGPRDNAVIAVVGGAIGNVALSVPGAPHLAVGEQLVFFGAATADRAIFTPVATFDGILPISAQNRRAAVTVSPRGTPEDLESFLRQVRSLSRRP